VDAGDGGERVTSYCFLELWAKQIASGGGGGLSRGTRCRDNPPG